MNISIFIRLASYIMVFVYVHVYAITNNIYNLSMSSIYYSKYFIYFHAPCDVLMLCFTYARNQIIISNVCLIQLNSVSNNVSRISSNCYVACNTMAALFRLPICTRFLTVMGSTNVKPVLCTN